MKSIFIALICCAFAFPLLGQQSNTEDAIKDAFARVYMESKTLRNFEDVDIAAILKDFEVTKKRYGAIIRAGAQGEQIELAANEEKLLQFLRSEEEGQQARINVALESLCEDHGIEFDQYQSMLEKFRSDPEYQQSLKPSFDKVISEQ